MYRQVVFRRNVLSLLDYPRQVAKSNVDLSRCPHSGYFQGLDPRCRECTQSYECGWLNSTDEFNDLASKSMDYLYRALTFAIDYVDAQNATAEHDTAICDCDPCEWVRSAHELANEFRLGAAQNADLALREK